MALSSRARNELIDKVNTDFDAIGSKAPCDRSSNQGPVAGEYFIASHLYKRAEARRKQAEKRAVQAGVLIDKEKDPRPPGTSEVLYNDSFMNISLQVSNAVVEVDTGLLIQELRRLRVSQAKIDEALEAAKKERRPQHRFTAAINVA